jgi:hypothetical protein
MEEIVDQIVPLVRILREKKGRELEASIGKLDPVTSRFVSGVSFAYFKRLFDVISQTQDPKPTPNHLANFFFPDGVRGRFDNKGNTCFIKKQTISRVNIRVEDRDLDIRISVSEEIPVKSYTCDSVPELVRLQERWSLSHKGQKEDTWKYEFTKVAQGTTKEKACKSAPTFEIELELESPGSAYNSDRRLAKSILLKVIDLLGRFDHNFNPIPITLKIHSTWNRPATGTV